VSELDVESEIYESLYGVPRRERTEVGPSGAPIVIVDGALGAAPPEMDTVVAVPPSLRGATSRPRADRRRAGAVLAAALVVVPVLALLLVAAGRSGTARVHLAPAPSRSAAPALAGTARSTPAPLHNPAALAASVSASRAQAADTASADNAAAQTQQLSNVHPRAHRTRTAHRPDRVVTRPTPPPPIRRPTAHQRPAPRPPATTAPGERPSSGQGGGLSSITGGYAAPTD
jgi:hypothetical protein